MRWSPGQRYAFQPVDRNGNMEPLVRVRFAGWRSHKCRLTREPLLGNVADSATDLCVPDACPGTIRVVCHRIRNERPREVQEPRSVLKPSRPLRVLSDLRCFNIRAESALSRRHWKNPFVVRDGREETGCSEVQFLGWRTLFSDSASLRRRCLLAIRRVIALDNLTIESACECSLPAADVSR